MALSFPSPSVAPSIHTEFVNGVKFDICEVSKLCYNLLYDTRSRYFLCVEDSHIVNYAFAERYCESANKDRWDMFCATKGECAKMIRDYEERCGMVSKWKEMLMQNNGISPMVLPKISDANNWAINRYGVKISA